MADLSAAAALTRKTVTINQAAEIVGVSRRTIYNWLVGGKVSYTRTASNRVRIFADTLFKDGNASRALPANSLGNATGDAAGGDPHRA